MSDIGKTPLKSAIERIQNLVDSFPTNNKENRAMRGAYVHSIEIIKEFLHLEEEEQKRMTADFFEAINKGHLEILKKGIQE
jgi:hypothetical protein